MKKRILNLILLNVMIFFALISIHELTHVLVGYCLGCEYQKAILFDNIFNNPHTELICSNKINETFVYIGSLVTTSIFGLAFLLLTKEKGTFFMISGISLIFSSLDISIAINQTLFYPLVTIGFILTTFGEYFMTSLYVNEGILPGLLNTKKELN